MCPEAVSSQTLTFCISVVPVVELRVGVEAAASGPIEISVKLYYNNTSCCRITYTIQVVKAAFLYHCPTPM